MRRPALLVRFPSLRSPRTSWPAITPKTAADYPELADDITTVDQEVGPDFRKADLAALGHQNRYRRQQVIIILGSALLTGFGGLQAVFPEQRWPGLVLGLLGALLAVLSTAVNELNALERLHVRAGQGRAAALRLLPVPVADRPVRRSGPGERAAPGGQLDPLGGGAAVTELARSPSDTVRPRVRPTSASEEGR